jgi:hypothetical protein
MDVERTLCNIIGRDLRVTINVHYTNNHNPGLDRYTAV